jgi:hypothetical protein
MSVVTYNLNDKIWLTEHICVYVARLSKDYGLIINAYIWHIYEIFIALPQRSILVGSFINELFMSMYKLVHSDDELVN